MTASLRTPLNDAISEAVIGAAIEVHKSLGPGLLESAYEECLASELRFRKVQFVRQHPLAITYRDVHIPNAYFIDMVVEQKLIVEIKSVEKIIPLHLSQLLTYMKLTNSKTGLLLNFNVPVLKDGIKRLVL